ncbi:hypothetical protein EYF80_065287 [Liparis tanakae]|uniref:Uncharacterized protein n=1 Tax=Liparis tanakae TaxID=230148 RepID=A0A4Z2E751_9TELE|nr:hypothetical protein EYF80_065287 [Liparis tanakae]
MQKFLESHADFRTFQIFQPLKCREKAQQKLRASLEHQGCPLGILSKIHLQPSGNRAGVYLVWVWDWDWEWGWDWGWGWEWGWDFLHPS